MVLVLITAIFGYLALGAVVAVPMALRGVNRLDAAAAAGSWGFRLLVFPGVMVLWPLVLRRWVAGGQA
ncbi:MAG: hypothetical protein ACFCBV_07950 [Phycisphaerales bacterium]